MKILKDQPFSLLRFNLRFIGFFIGLVVLGLILVSTVGFEIKGELSLVLAAVTAASYEGRRWGALKGSLPDERTFRKLKVLMLISVLIFNTLKDVLLVAAISQSGKPVDLTVFLQPLLLGLMVFIYVAIWFGMHFSFIKAVEAEAGKIVSS